MNLITPAYAQKPIQDTKDIYGQFDLAFNSLGDFIGVLTGLAFSIAAIMVMFYFIIGAFELVTSQGDKAHIVSARSKIYHSLIGFILLIVIFLVMQYLPQQLGLKNFSLF